MKESVFNLFNQNTRIDDRITAALERLSSVFRVLLWEHAKDTGLSPIQLQVLIFLLTHVKSQSRLTLLAREMNVTKATMSDTIRVLEEKKLVSKKSDTKDLRIQYIGLTEKGKTIASRASEFADPVRNQVSALSSQDQQAMVYTLLSILYQLEQAGVMSRHRMCFTCIHYDPKHKGKPYCKLLKIPLVRENLRLDCPEHEMNEPELADA